MFLPLTLLACVGDLYPSGTGSCSGSAEASAQQTDYIWSRTQAGAGQHVVSFAKLNAERRPARCGLWGMVRCLLAVLLLFCKMSIHVAC